MLLFLLNLSIRNRVDRTDGVGDLVWWGDAGVSATVEGFGDALEMKACENDLPAGMVAGLKRHLAACSEKELFDMAAAMVARYDREAPELPLIQRHLSTHISALQQAIQQSFSTG